MPNVSLTPEIERFAEACARSGRYGNVREVARAAPRLLQDMEQERLASLDGLAAAEADGEANSPLSVDEVAAELDAVLEDARGRRG